MRARRPILLAFVAMLSAAQPALVQAAGRAPAGEQQFSDLDRLLIEWVRIDAQMKLASLVVFNVLATQEERRALDLKIAAVTQIKDPKEREAKLIVVQGEAVAELARMDFAERGADLKEDLNDEQWQQLGAALAILIDTLPRGKNAIEAFKPAMQASMIQAKQQFDSAQGIDKIKAGVEVARRAALIAAIAAKGLQSLAMTTKVASDLTTFMSDRPKPSPLALKRTVAIAAFD